MGQKNSVPDPNKPNLTDLFWYAEDEHGANLKDRNRRLEIETAQYEQSLNRAGWNQDMNTIQNMALLGGSLIMAIVVLMRF